MFHNINSIEHFILDWLSIRELCHHQARNGLYLTYLCSLYECALHLFWTGYMTPLSSVKYYLRKILILIYRKAGHKKKQCSVVSTSTLHSLQIGLIWLQFYRNNFTVYCKLWPVRAPVLAVTLTCLHWAHYWYIWPDDML